MNESFFKRDQIVNESQADSIWDLLVPTSKRRELSKLRWKILQRGERVESHWAHLRELWALEKGSAVESVPSRPKRLLAVESKLRDSKDGTIKWLLRTRDNQLIEAVMLPNSKTRRVTACISSQVGCGVKCSFCATGTLGMVRQLSTYEILEQLLIVREESYLEDRQLRNVVFMGMGEPLHNWENVKDAIQFILRDDGFYFSPAHVCISTAGVTKNLIDCARTFPNLRLAISLHSCDPNVRSKIVPRGVSSLSQIRECIESINAEFPHRAVWIEVVMLDGITDRDEDVVFLKSFCDGLTVEINLIPYNNSSESPSFSKTSGLKRSERTWEFAQQLRAAGFFTTIRYSGGQNIAAACGQLAASNKDMDSLPVVHLLTDN